MSALGVFQGRCITFLCRTSHSSKGTAALATVSITEVALEEELARVEEDDGAPSAVKAAMGDLWQQMAETAGTDEAEAARKAEEGRLAKEAAEAEAAKKAETDLLFEKQLSLLETAEERQQETQQQKQPGTLFLPLKLRRKLKRKV